MARGYDSSRRKQGAEQTRTAIVSAAFNVHGNGRFDLELIARDAGVSLATVRKHFPTRRRLAAACAAYGIEHVAMPDPTVLASLTDARERLVATVQQAFELYESLFGRAWQSSCFEDDTSVFAMTLERIAEPIDALVETAVGSWPRHGDGMPDPRQLLAGMVGPLTYLALREHSGLSPAETTGTITRLLLSVFEPGFSWRDGGKPPYP